jgi:hypothetical protein
MHMTELLQMADDLSDADFMFEVVAKAGRTATIDGEGTNAIEDGIKASLRTFAHSLETHVQKIAVLEDLTENRVTIWFRFDTNDRHPVHDKAMATDASALKFAAQSVLTVLNWMDGVTQPRLSDLHQAIRVLAWGTSATGSSHPSIPSFANLLSVVRGWQRVKEVFRESASARVTLQEGSADLDLAKKIPDLTSLLDQEVVRRTGNMILVVEQPDYRGTGEWLVKHGQARFLSDCVRGELLERFHRRELDIRPGDALRCSVEFKTSYGPDYEVIDERIAAIEILEILSITGKVELPERQQHRLSEEAAHAPSAVAFRRVTADH